MNNKIISILFFSFTFFSCSNNSVQPESKLPDLIITNITYSYPTGPIIGSIIDTLWIQNIGQGDFYGLLYIAQADEKYYRKYGLFSNIGLDYFQWDSNSVKPKLLKAGEIARVLDGSLIPSDTNIIRFHISTDTVGRGDDNTTPLPTYPESNYSNNDYLLIINKFAR